MGTDKGLSDEKDAPPSADSELEKTFDSTNKTENEDSTNGHFDEVSEPKVEDANPPQDERPKPSEPEPQQVSEEIPTEERSAETDLADSEQKDSEEKHCSAQKVNSTTQEDRDREGVPQAPQEEPRSIDEREEDTATIIESASNENTHEHTSEPTEGSAAKESDGFPAAQEAPVQDREVLTPEEINTKPEDHDKTPRPLMSEAPAISHEEDHYVESIPLSETKPSIPECSSDESGNLDNQPLVAPGEKPSNSDEHAISEEANKGDASVIPSKDAPPPALKGENERDSEPKMEDTDIEMTTSIDDPKSENESRRHDPAGEPVLSHVEAPSKIEEPHVEESKAKEQGVEVAALKMADTETKELSKIEKPASEGPLSEGNAISEDSKAVKETLSQAGASRSFNYLGIKGEHELKEPSADTPPVPIESQTKSEEPPIEESRIENPASDSVALHGLSDDSVENQESTPESSEQQEAPNQDAPSNTKKEGDGHRQEILSLSSPKVVNSAKIETLNHQEEQSNFSTTKATEPARREIASTPKVFEDPEDVKAREEIARLNAELLKAAMEEETAQQDHANQGHSDNIPENKTTTHDSHLPATHIDVSHEHASEPLSEQLPTPADADADIGSESIQGLPDEDHEPQNKPKEESSEIPLVDNSTETSTAGPDSAIDVRTPRQIAAENLKLGLSDDQTSTKVDNSHLESETVNPESIVEPAPHKIIVKRESSTGAPSAIVATAERASFETASDDRCEPQNLDAEQEQRIDVDCPNILHIDHHSVNNHRALEASEDILPKSTTFEGLALETNHHVTKDGELQRDVYEDYDMLHGESLNRKEVDHEPESNLPSHPRTRALSGADLMDEGREFSRAESPVTILNSDDLFEEEEEEVEEGDSKETSGFEIDPAKFEHGEERGPSKSPLQIEEDASSSRAVDSRSPIQSGYELELPLNKQHRINQEVHRTNSGKFASLVDAVRSEEPIVSHIVKKQMVPEIGMPGGGHFSDEILDDYQYSTPDHEEREDAALRSWSQLEQAKPQYADDEGDARPLSPTLHVRTHTADTVPSFEHYAQSDHSAPSTPDTVISPPRQAMQDEPTIRQSWMHQGEEFDHHEVLEELKTAASSLQQPEFESFNSQTYSSYVTPKPSLANLQPNHDVLDSCNSSPESAGDGEEAYNTTGASHTAATPGSGPFDASQPFDSPISTTRSLQSNSPSRSLFSKASTPPPPPTRSPHRPTFPSPSSLAKTPVSSPSTANSSFFQKTRSLFESSSRQETQSTPPLTRPKSLLYTTPSPPQKPASLRSRPSSLTMRSPFNSSSRYDKAPTSPTDELLVPRSLDGNGKLPSPAFVLPGETRGRAMEKEREEEFEPRERSSSSFLGGISRLGGLVGLEGSMHNPARMAEGQPLLEGEGTRHVF